MNPECYEKYEDKGLTGLANLGNSCYMNSCMQLLSHTYELNEFLDILNKGKINNTNEALVIIEWDRLRTMIWSENCTIAPWGFLKAIHNVATEKKLDLFSGYVQNDISEYLIFIIDNLHNGIKREVVMTINGNIKNKVDKLANECYKMMKQLYKSEYSEILNIFYGISATQIKSAETNEILSRTCEPYSIISLSIPDKRETNLFECLDLYCEDEDLSGNNAWYNDITKKNENVKKNVVFWSLPNVLIIDLKRYNNSNKKKNLLVDISLNDVDFSKYVKGYNPDSYIYDLYGVANHSGGVKGGHYTANIRTANGKWYNFNDTIINEINESKVITTKTYCLFFRKKNKN